MFNNLFARKFDNSAAGGTPPPAPPADWDAYVASLPEEQRTTVQSLYDTKNAGLLNSVKATREERDTFAGQLRDAAKKVEKGSAAETKLLEQANQLDEANRRADFYEAAPAQECRNPKAAFAIAKTDNLFTRTGSPDWKAIKEAIPELFGTALPPKPPKGKGGAGAGTEHEPKGQTVNDFIRAAAGKNVVANE